MKLTKKEVTVAEFYLYTTASSGVAIYQGGNHDIKKVAWAAVVGVFGPVVKSLIDKAKTKYAK